MGKVQKTNLKKIDNRIRLMIENGVVLGHRSFFVIVGNNGRDQVYVLHHILSKAKHTAQPTVLWCYKKDLGFAGERKTLMRTLKRKVSSGMVNVNENDPFQLFLLSTNIRYCYYKDTHSILGNTFGMCVLQDFEAITPNILARTIETVEGGGIVVLLLKTVSSLKQLYTMSMDVHARYRTDARYDIVGRFNERFILSLSSCKSCLVMDEKLNVLPLSSHVAKLTAVTPKTVDDPLTPEEIQLKELKDSLQSTQPVGVLIACCMTLDQAMALLKFIDAISEKTLQTTVTLTAARGRGKSAALGLAIAGAIAFSYSNIFVTSPSPENLRTLFDFIFKGFDVLGYQEHIDYAIAQSTNPEFNNAVIRVNVFREHRQTVQYIHPSDAAKLGQAELVVIDEAAAIPLPLVKSLLGPYLVFMSSTINGYEGTGRSLSLKLINQLRQQMIPSSNITKPPNLSGSATADSFSVSGRVLKEVELNESIRYKSGDDVETWLNSLLCLDANLVSHLASGCPVPQDCELYYINRDTLFSYHQASEKFLQRLMALYVAAHYKNTPDDLQMMSDAPSHHLFCLLGPVTTQDSLPEVLCVIQVCLEGDISKESVRHAISQGKSAFGDLIPWTLVQQFQDENFPSLSGARIVRIATHPNYQKMGYGSWALELLSQYYDGKIPTTDELIISSAISIEPVPESDISLLKEKLTPRANLPPLLLKLSERRCERLDYLGVSYGLTSELLKKVLEKSLFYSSLCKADAGEHTCIMLKRLNVDDSVEVPSWTAAFFSDFRCRFASLLSYQFRFFSSALALSVLQNVQETLETKEMTRAELDIHLSAFDLKRLDSYARNLVDYHLILDLLPTLAKLFFLKRMKGVELGNLQMCIFLGLGLQCKSVDELAKELDMPVSQILAIFNRIIRRFSEYITGIAEAEIERTLPDFKEAKQRIEDNPSSSADGPAVSSILSQKSEEPMKVTALRERRQKHKKFRMSYDEMMSYRIKGSEKDWLAAIETNKERTSVSLKSGRVMKPLHVDKLKGEPVPFEKTRKKSGKKRKLAK